MTDDELAAIEEQSERWPVGRPRDYVRALLAEVRRLREVDVPDNVAFHAFAAGAESRAESLRARAVAVCDRSMSDCLCAESEMPCGACLEATRIAVHIRSLPLTDDAEGT